MEDPILIDGSQGEGGGQILRSSLALALLTGRTVIFDKIRAGREKPGLMRQHLAAVHAAAEISDATVTGAAVGARTLTFAPREVRAGAYRFSIGTAGSTTLVLQTVLPALLVASGPSTLTFEGGTHNPWAPPFDFLQKTFVPLINRMGPRVELELERHGFYPAGGGRFRVQINPAPVLRGFDLCRRGGDVECRARILLANLPDHIARRELREISAEPGWGAQRCMIEEVASAGPGNVVLLELAGAHVTEVVVGFGQQGVKAERVARQALREARDYQEADVPVGVHLADQLMLPLGISAWQSDAIEAHQSARRQRGGAYRTLPLTLHATTHAELLRQFLNVTIDVEQPEADGPCTVRIGPPA